MSKGFIAVVGKFLGLPLPPKPLAYAMAVLVVLLPVLVLFHWYRGNVLPTYVFILAIVVLVIYGYLAYLAWKATRLLRRELEV